LDSHFFGRRRRPAYTVYSFSRQNNYQPEEPEDSFDESKNRDKNLHCCPRKEAEEFVLRDPLSNHEIF
jgi:hypothetical protein